MEDFRVIVAGGRYFDDYELLEKNLDYFLQNKDNIIIISGTAKGADSLGELYAKNKNLRIERFKPKWDKFGKGAGYRRNVEMAEIGDALVAFWDEESKGTKHMIDIAEKQGLKVRVVKY